MLDMIIMGGTAFVTLAGYLKTRSFFRHRLRFVDAALTPAAPVVTGAVAALAAGPIVAVLPWIGLPTALFFGLGVGAGALHGARDIRKRLPGG